MMELWLKRETEGKNRRYHCEMMMKELEELKFQSGTRDALLVDLPERAILIELLTEELKNRL